MAQQPRILLVFANPLGDLSFVANERREIEDTLLYAKAKQLVDYTIFDSRSLPDIVRLTSGAGPYQADILHYSGHAGDQKLLIDLDGMDADAFCTYLQLIKTRIVFLNGCCTHTLLNRIFAETNVEAAIATYNKVKDKQAATLAAEFYKALLLGINNDLGRTFDNLAAACGNSVLDPKGCLASQNREFTFSSNASPDHDPTKFNWGIFYRNNQVKTYSIYALKEQGSNDTQALRDSLVEAEAELAQAQQAMDDVTGNAAAPQAWVKRATTELTIATEKVAALKRQLKAKNDAKLAEEANAQEAAQKKDFTNAVKQINYFDQREVYLEQFTNTFSCLAALGDADAVLQLLLLKLEEEYSRSADKLLLQVDARSAINTGFWPGLARGLALPEQSNQADIASALIKNYFLDIDLGSSRQHIFLKWNVSGLSPDTIAQTTNAFWLEIKLALAKLNEPGKIIFLHKMILLLWDDSADQGRHQLMTNLEATFTPNLPAALKVMPWIEPLNKEDIEGWIKQSSLHTVGIKRTMAEDIYNNSDKGKIRKVLSVVRKKASIQSLPIFDYLNILPDATQNIFD